ncbi:hypothetical protein [Bosea lupini]|uniref:hypothetical protein n=1 Tax=Bosea lupini TaxID=1036779 RepID=UPI0011606329|nr:hypothetical protein [Bosea lupini]
MNKKTLGAEAMPVRDLADFHLRWPEFRRRAVDVSQSAFLKPQDRETIMWLIRMADRIGPRDLN